MAIYVLSARLQCHISHGSTTSHTVMHIEATILTLISMFVQSTVLTTILETITSSLLIPVLICTVPLLNVVGDDIAT